jgi:hypothetical protein
MCVRLIMDSFLGVVLRIIHGICAVALDLLHVS